MIGCDVINVASRDLAAGLPFVKTLEDSSSIPFISANILDNNTGELCFEPYILLEHEPFTIGVVGVTSRISTKISEVRVSDYILEGKKYIEELKEKSDIVVVLVSADRRERKKCVEEFQNADYIFMSRDLSKIQPKNLRVDPPFLYTSNKQGKYLSVINLTLTEIDSPIVDITPLKKKIDVLDRRLINYQKKDTSKTLEELYRNAPATLQRIKDTQKEKKKTEEIVATTLNHNAYESVAMNRQMGENENMLRFVNEALLKYVKLGGKMSRSKSSKKKPRPKQFKKNRISKQ